MCSACRQNLPALLSYSGVSQMETFLLLYLNIPASLWGGMCLVCYVPDGWILTPCAHPFWCLLLPPGFHFTPALPILLPQAGCLPFGKTYVSLGVAGSSLCRGSSKSCPSPEQWNFVVSKSHWPECCSKRVWCLLPLFRMRELQSNIKKAARALNYSAMEHCHSSIKLFWPVVFYGVHCS